MKDSLRNAGLVIVVMAVSSCSGARSKEYYGKHHAERSKMIEKCAAPNKPIGTSEDCKNALASANDDL